MSGFKTPTADIAREIWNRQNGETIDPSIDLSEYGLDENSDPMEVLRVSANIASGPSQSASPEYKNPTADVAREIWRRQNGETPDPSIDLSEYGLDENSDPMEVLRIASDLKESPGNVAPAGPSGNDEPETPAEPISSDANVGFVNNMNSIGGFVNNLGDFGNQLVQYYSDNKTESNAPNTPTENETVAEPNPYQDILDRYLDEYAAIGDFQYDANNPLSQYYDRTFRNAALLAQKNALASGGTNYSSTKQALANNAYNNTISQLGDLQSQLYQLAYDAYKTERNNALQNVEMARTLKNDADSQKYQEWYMKNTESEQERNQSNIDMDRQLSYASLSANYGNYDALAEITGLDFTKQETRDAFDDAYKQFQATGTLDGFKALGIDTSYIEQERQIEIAVRNATYGDYSGLEALGIDTTRLTRDDNVQLGLYLAQYGDYSFLEDALGVDLSAADYAYNLQIGLAAAEGGDYSYLDKMGFDTSKLKQNDALSLAVTAAEYGDFSKLGEILGVDLSDAQYAYNLQIGLTAAEGGDYSYLEGMGFDTSFMKQLNQKKLTTGSSGSGGGSSRGGSSGGKYISQSNLDSALEAYNIGGESNLYAYTETLLNKGYTEDQVAEIESYVWNQVIPKETYKELGYAFNSGFGVLNNLFNH